jgi:hypothetical protein
MMSINRKWKEVCQQHKPSTLFQLSAGRSTTPQPSRSTGALRLARLYLRADPHFDGRTVVGLARQLPFYTWDCLAAESKAGLKAIARRALEQAQAERAGGGA